MILEVFTSSDHLHELLKNPGVGKMVRQLVVGSCLHLENPGMAEFAMAEPRKTIPLENLAPGCIVVLSGVSVTRARSSKDYEDASISLEEVFKGLILAALPQMASHECQLQVSIKLDRPPLDQTSSVIERPVFFVKNEVHAQRP